MSSERAVARPHSPSSRRIAEARRSGHVPRVPLLGLVSTVVALWVAVTWLGPRVVTLAHTLLRAPLRLAGDGLAADAYRQAWQLSRDLLGHCVVGLALVVLSGVLGGWIAQGPAFTRLGAHDRARFGPLSPSRVASGLWCLGLCCLGGFLLASWQTLSLASLPAAATTWALSVVLLSVLCLVVDVGFARARYFASLWLTRREYQDEQRADFGHPQVRAAREQARRAFRASP